MTELSKRHYWVRINERISGKREHRGAGFLVTRRFVLTAMHCLRDVSSEDALLEIELPDRQVVHGRLCQVANDADLALIALEDAASHDLPLAKTDRPRPNSSWRVTYTPPNESSQLSGWLMHEPVDYGSDPVVFKGIQLTVRERLGTYQGYSGSPVDTDPWRPVVGILMVEQLSRDGSNTVTNVVFAASILHAMDRFPQLSFEQQRRAVRGPQPPPSEISDVSDCNDSAPGWTPNAEVDDHLKQLNQWEEAGRITPAEATEERRRMLQKLGDRVLEGRSDGG